VVLVGGYDGNRRSDTWFLTDAGWEPGPVSPPDFIGRAYHSVAYDALRARLVVFGGRPFLGMLDDTWYLRFESLAPAEVCTLATDDDTDALVGCDDPDCWGFCTPFCPPEGPCDAFTSDQCGDLECNTHLESCRNCSVDCGVCF
jgi:hypothetical protein